MNNKMQDIMVLLLITAMFCGHVRAEEEEQAALEIMVEYIEQYEDMSLEELMMVDVTLVADGSSSVAREEEFPGPGHVAQYIEKYEGLSLEELMNVDVTSVAGVKQEWFKTPAAMYVITAEDIRRSGHRSIAEALRMVPGVYVAQVDAHTWVVGARGFTKVFGNKMLVLIDGRTTYDPLFSGTFWDVQEVLLEDLDRIEVIRGPGATLWGANAVNGVINITTKSAKETQGLYLSGGVGTEERGFGAVRYGAQVADNAWFRVWGQYHNHDTTELPGGGDAYDDWDMGRGGFRFDAEGDDDLLFTAQGDLYSSFRMGTTPLIAHLFPTSGVVDGRASGGNFLFRFSQERPEGNGWSLQGYYDRTERVTSGGFEVNRDTFDLDFRNHFKWADVHETVWGLGYRHTSDDTRGIPLVPFGSFGFMPDSRSMQTFSGFIQDTITLLPDELFFMVGSKFEENDTSGFEFQPSGRIWWTPSDRQTFWAAISRPVRTPSRTEDDLSVVTPLLVFSGDRDTEAEELLAYELGHRIMVTPDLTLDTAFFFNDYRDLISTDLTPTLPQFGVFGNRGQAITYGVEVAGTWQVAPNWRLAASYSFLRVEEETPLEVVFDDPEGSTPRHMAQLRSMLDITQDLELNSALYYVDRVPRVDADSYFRFDVGVVWHVNDHFDLGVWGQNLIEESHREFNGTETERGVYMQATLRF